MGSAGAVPANTKATAPIRAHATLAITAPTAPYRAILSEIIRSSPFSSSFRKNSIRRSVPEASDGFHDLPGNFFPSNLGLFTRDGSMHRAFVDADATPGPFVAHGTAAAIVDSRFRGNDGEEGHRLTRSPNTILQGRTRYQTLWSATIPCACA